MTAQTEPGKRTQNPRMRMVAKEVFENRMPMKKAMDKHGYGRTVAPCHVRATRLWQEIAADYISTLTSTRNSILNELSTRDLSKVKTEKLMRMLGEITTTISKTEKPVRRKVVSQDFEALSDEELTRFIQEEEKMLPVEAEYTESEDPTEPTA